MNLAARATRAFFFPHLLPSSSPTCTLVPLHYIRRSTGARGKAVMRAAATDQAGNDGLEGGVRGKLLGFWRDLRFFRSLFAFHSLGVEVPVCSWRSVGVEWSEEETTNPT
ncbi:hypothetical protein Taro_048162 [Colocasia esculenta]|uniref:Uncharacterized protein n=1 Tax=Colocasia esculenta TaxID=4460 RepID=A0A843X846_COLES|nr:hypothetical protein [Colocasia esculenta]